MGPSDSLSPSAASLGSLRGLPSSADFAAGRGGSHQLTSHALVAVLPLRPRRRVPSKPEEDGTCCLRPQLAGSASGFASVEATCAFTLVAARQLACRPQNGFVDGLQTTRFPSWLPSKLRGFWFFPRWVCLPPSVLAFWSYKLTKPAQAMELRSLSPVFDGHLRVRHDCR